MSDILTGTERCPVCMGSAHRDGCQKCGGQGWITKRPPRSTVEETEPRVSGANVSNDANGWRGTLAMIADIARSDGLPADSRLAMIRDAALAALRTPERQHPDWRPIDDELPPEGAEVLVYRPGNNGRRRFMARHYDGQWMPLAHTRPLSPPPTHWMPLPSAPTSEETRP